MKEEKLRRIVKEEISKLAEAPVEGDLLEKLGVLRRELRQWTEELSEAQRTAGRLGFGNHFDREILEKAKDLQEEFERMIQNIENYG